MSQSMGRADGRCFTVNNSSQLFNNYVMQKHGIAAEDNYSYRKLLKQKGPGLVDEIRGQQQGKGPCVKCDKPMMNLAHMY